MSQQEGGAGRRHRKYTGKKHRKKAQEEH